MYTQKWWNLWNPLPYWQPLVSTQNELVCKQTIFWVRLSIIWYNCATFGYYLSNFNTFSAPELKLELCYDYSFWQNDGRCFSRNDDLRDKSYPFLCNGGKNDCSQTLPNQKDTFLEGLNLCPDATSEENCDLRQNFFCNLSKTCIPQGKQKSIHWLCEANQ